MSTRVQKLLDFAIANKGPLPPREASLLNSRDGQVMEIMLAIKRQCSKWGHQRQYWSPKLCQITKTYSYWRQKLLMSQKSFFRWDHLDRLHCHTMISDHEHSIRDTAIIQDHLKQARNAWKACKKIVHKSAESSLRSELLSSLLNSTAWKKRHYVPSLNQKNRNDFTQTLKKC